MESENHELNKAQESEWVTVIWLSEHKQMSV